MNVIFPIEIPNRELIYKSQLAAHLASEGFHCYLALKKYIPELLENLSPCIYFDKGFHPGVSELLHEKVKKLNGFIVSLDEEGAVDFEDFSTLENRYSPKLFNNSDIVFMWGNKQYQHFKMKLQLSNMDKVIVSGHPRFDSLKEMSNGAFKDLISEISHEFSPFVLVNLNCGFGNNIKGDEFVKANYGPRVKHLGQIMAYDKTKFDAYIRLIKDLCQTTTYKIIVRPHPEEDINPYKKLLEREINSQKCILTTEHSVLAWNAAAEYIIHPDCTSAVEAILQGKYPISFLPDDPNKIFTYIPVTASAVINDPDLIVSKILSQQKIELPLDALENLKAFFHLSGLSELTIVNAIKNLPLRKEKKNLNFKCKVKFKLRGIFDKYFSKTDTFSKAKQKGFDDKLINRAINASKFGKSVEVTQLAINGCYLVSSNYT